MLAKQCWPVSLRLKKRVHKHVLMIFTTLRPGLKVKKISDACEINLVLRAFVFLSDTLLELSSNVLAQWLVMILDLVM